MTWFARGQAGDTIVEVLIAIAIVSLVLVGAYTTTDHNMAETQDAQERSQAIKLAETQLEQLREHSSIANGHCFINGIAKAVTVFPGDPCSVTSSGATAVAGDQPAFRQIILTPGASAPTGCTAASATVYTVCVHWESLINTSQDNVTMYYRP